MYLCVQIYGKTLMIQNDYGRCAKDYSLIIKN